MIDPAHHPGVFQALERFRGFYIELSAAAAAVEDGSWLASGAASDDDGIEAGTRRLAQRLQGAVTRHAGLPGPRLPDGGTPVEMGYVLAAFADEVFLHELDWPGRAYWDELLLEERLYGSRVAGERLFDLAKILIAGNATGQEDLVVALAQVLALGFRGRHRFGNDRGEIRRLRRQLYQLALHQPPPTAVDWREALPPNLPLDGGVLARVAPLRPWVFATIAAGLLYLLVTHLVWLREIGPTLERADRIAALAPDAAP